MKKRLSEADYKKQFERFASCFSITVELYGALGGALGGPPSLAVTEEDSLGRGHRCWLVDKNNYRISVRSSYRDLMKSIYGKRLHHQTYGGLSFDDYALDVPKSYSALEVELAVRGY